MDKKAPEIVTSAVGFFFLNNLILCEDSNNTESLCIVTGQFYVDLNRF